MPHRDHEHWELAEVRDGTQTTSPEHEVSCKKHPRQLSTCSAHAVKLVLYTPGLASQSELTLWIAMLEWILTAPVYRPDGDGDDVEALEESHRVPVQAHRKSRVNTGVLLIVQGTTLIRTGDVRWYLGHTPSGEGNRSAAVALRRFKKNDSAEVADSPGEASSFDSCSEYEEESPEATRLAR
ncbi:hypothetical protein NHX12_010883 [Muraenolepis orangiensis]|uniref:Uncharacterized protein n=1 Tax=Muraenolepis orangiensis TaxID=630683 RepID=A0A9Q0DHV3_9TELE|nr:hypothetical protein NHX12_010883 [Muraenolepis orangiensis]